MLINKNISGELAPGRGKKLPESHVVLEGGSSLTVNLNGAVGLPSGAFQMGISWVMGTSFLALARHLLQMITASSS